MVVYFAGELGRNRLWDLLNRNTGARETVCAESDFPKGPFSNYLGM